MLNPQAPETEHSSFSKMTASNMSNSRAARLIEMRTALPLQLPTVFVSR
jgi:hypothetical protein